MVSKKVSWICDVRGWAYENLADRYSGELKNYSHKKEFMREAGIKKNKKDIIVVFNPQYLKYLDKKDFSKVILRLDGFRPLGFFK